MNRENLRKVEVFDFNQNLEYTGYFHGYFTQTYSLDNRNDLKAIVELENGELLTRSINNIKFIS